MGVKAEIGVLFGMTDASLSLTCLLKSREAQRLPVCLSMLHHTVSSGLTVDFPGTKPISADQDLEVTLEHGQFPGDDGLGNCH